MTTVTTQAADVIANINRLASEHYTGHCNVKGCGFVTDKFDDVDSLRRSMAFHVDHHKTLARIFDEPEIYEWYRWLMRDKRGVVIDGYT